jgi:hypothetical protein
VSCNQATDLAISVCVCDDDDASLCVLSFGSLVLRVGRDLILHPAPPRCSDRGRTAGRPAWRRRSLLVFKGYSTGAHEGITRSSRGLNVIDVSSSLEMAAGYWSSSVRVLPITAKSKCSSVANHSHVHDAPVRARTLVTAGERITFVKNRHSRGRTKKAVMLLMTTATSQHCMMGGASMTTLPKANRLRRGRLGGSISSSPVRSVWASRG